MPLRRATPEIAESAEAFAKVFTAEMDAAINGAAEEWFAEHTTMKFEDWAEYKPRLLFEVYNKLANHCNATQMRLWLFS